MQGTKSAARQAEKTVSELSGATREFAQQGADFAMDVSNKTKATAEDATKAAEAAYSSLASGAIDFHRQWIEMVRENTNASLDFVHQLLGVKSPAAFAELTAVHTRKQAEAFAEQARHLTGMAQKMTTDAVAPLQASMKSALNRAA
jgi:phasin family protein